MPEAALDNWQPVWNAQVSISTPVCVSFELRPGAGDIHICWFNFDALAQGNAYKPTKERINYRGPGGDRTHDLQTEATPPAASCPARTGKRYSNRKETICVPLLNAGFEPGVPDTKSPADWMFADKPTELSRIHTYIHTCIHTHIHTCMYACMLACMHTCMHACMHTCIHTYIFVVVNFDALTQASDVQIERRQVVFFCWKQDLNPGSQTPNRQQTECSLANRLSYQGIHTYIHTYMFVVVNFDALAQASDIRI